MASMFGIVTDADVLAQIAIDDGLAQSVDQQFTSLAAKVPAAMLAAWKARLASYQAWAAMSRDALSGGFLFGAWFGVPEMGDQALAWQVELGAGAPANSLAPGSPPTTGWQTLANQVAAGQTPTEMAATAITPQQIADANAVIPKVLPSVPPGTSDALSISTGTKVVLGLIGAALLVNAVKR